LKGAIELEGESRKRVVELTFVIQRIAVMFTYFIHMLQVVYGFFAFLGYLRKFLSPKGYLQKEKFGTTPVV
jgi:hypothetical protein